jgi:hypothetical protein
MQPQMGMMLQPFMFDMNAMMQMGQMNQLQGLQGLDVSQFQMGINPMMMGMGFPVNNFQQSFNENKNIYIIFFI